MEQEKIANLIKKIRKDNHLTQKELADKYHVTYQAVSKWENGLNMPDTSLLKEISKDYNISLDDILDGNFKKRKTKKIFIISLIIIVIILSLILIFNRNSDFKFKTIESGCNNFNITGSIAYNNSKSSIYISNVNYCGGDDNKKYSHISCNLYEQNGDDIKKIEACNYENNEKITLEEFLKQVSFNTNNYSKICKDYQKDNLYLEIEASNNNDLVTYKIPLKLNNSCN